MVFPNLLCGDGGEPNLVAHGPGVPRFTDTEAVHLTHLHVSDHLGRRDSDEVDVLVGMDASGGEVVAQPHRMGSRRKGHGEGHRFAQRLGLFNEGLQGLRILLNFAHQFGLEGDGLAVAIENPRKDHRLLGRTQEPHRRGNGHANEHVRGLVIPGLQLVSNHRPTGFLGNRRLDAVFLEDAFLVGNDDGGAIGQRDNAKTHVRGFW